MILKINTVFWIIFSIAIIFALIIILLIFYIKWVVKRAGENKKDAYTLLNKRARKDSIVFLGDSLTEFYRLDEFFTGLDIYNRGIAANTTNDVLMRLDENVVNISPRKIFLQIGTNDFGERKKVPEVYDNIIKIIDILKSKLQRAEIILLSLYPVNKKRRLHSHVVVGARNNKNIDILNEKLSAYCALNNLLFIDVASHLKDEDGNLNKEYTLEGLHLNSYGYLKITEIIKNYVF